MRFEAKIALITAAGAGIGKATTEIMVREGATVIAVENQQGRLDSLVAALANQFAAWGWEKRAGLRAVGWR